ncbi:MAG: hypothetical protein PHY16_00475 [Methylobacter sp.]|nr:hypothetical protein [Methylobacter sp.]
MEISITGEGEVVIRFIDQNGRTLLQEKIVVSGSPTVEARRSIELSLKTTSGVKLIAPVLVRQSSPQQSVVFDREQPSIFTRKRCEEIGCTTEIADDAERGCAETPAEGMLGQSDDEFLANLMQEELYRRNIQNP